MRDEFSFKSIKLRSISEFPDELIDDKNLQPPYSFPPSEFSLNPNNEFSNSLTHLKMETAIAENSENNKTAKNSEFEKKESKESKVKKNVYEYFTKNKILNKNDFDSFLSYIGLREIWSKKDEQNILWDTITEKAEDKNNVNYGNVLAGICNLFEESDDNCENKDKNENLEVINEINENCIDEYLQKINDNNKLLFDIKFINEIFLNNNEMKINISDVMNEIKEKYRFININNNDLETYLKNLSNNNISNNNTYELNKELVNYVNTVIKIKPNDNNNSIITNSIKSINIQTNNIINSKEKIICQLNKIDNIISDILKTIITFNSNKNLLNLFQNYYENIIINEKKYLYNELLSNNINNKIPRKMTDSLSENNLNFQKRNKILLVPNDENDYLKQQIQNLKERNEYLQKEITELKSKFESKSCKKLVKVNSYNKNNINNNSTNNIKYKRNSTAANDRNFLMNNIINYNLKKNNLSNTSYNSSNNNIINTSDSNNRFSYDNNESNNISNRFFNKSSSNGINDYISNDDLTYSRLDLFSTNGNNTINGKFMLDSSALGNVESSNNFSINDSGNYTPTLSPKDDSLLEKFSPINEKILDQEYNNSINSKKSIVKNMNERKNNSSKFYNIVNNKMSFGISNNLITDNIMNNKTNINSININNSNNNNNISTNNNTLAPVDESFSVFPLNYFADFEYLFFKKNIKKLFMHNNEKVNSNEIYSDRINYMLNNTKKKSGMVLITSQCLYILNDIDIESDDQTEIGISLRISHKLLESITISDKYFNYLLLNFNEGTFIIIETYRRVFLLNYLKILFNIYKHQKLIVYYSNCFDIAVKNKKIEKFEIKKNKNFLITPNFEISLKFGFLLKYKENFFSGSFYKKFIVLSDIGLLEFSKNTDNVPKMIIPIIGSLVKYTFMKDFDLYCFRIKTPDDKSYIFGSKNKKEIMDWIEELVTYKEEYKKKMKIVTEDFICL